VIAPTSGPINNPVSISAIVTNHQKDSMPDCNLPPRCRNRRFSVGPRPTTKYESPMPAQKTRLWLMYPSRLITRPVVYELGKTFPVVTNVRQASVTEEIGVVSLELEGEREEIKKAIAWLEDLGVKVEPVEINTIEG
jgi:L-aspartate semialdehyde sulfurtransferase ferredoxin